ncbi:MAG: ATP-binding protein [Haloferula sp.]
MIARDLAPVLLRAAGEYPVVTLTGPRQSGKTTLVREMFPDHGYCNLEHPEIRSLAETDPRSFFELNPGRLIIDEVQRVPELLSWIQVRVDEAGIKGHYILTGSHQLSLHEAIAQSLAGRTALLRLLPFSFAELRAVGISPGKGEALLKGFMPRIYDDDLEPSFAYRNYFQTYVERDVRQLIRLKDVTLFERFLKLLAGRVGQPINYQSLGNDVGVSRTTVTEWLSILEASFIIFTLAPYYRNFGKRLIKSPKIYFVEPGLATWLLGIENVEQAMRDPLHGNLFENMVVADALKERLNEGRDPNLYFWRDTNGNEIDLLWDRQRDLVPMEIKSAMTWNKEFPKAIRRFQKTIGVAERGYVVYAGEMEPSDESCTVVPFSKLASVFRDRNG